MVDKKVFNINRNNTVSFMDEFAYKNIKTKKIRKKYQVDQS
jgi:hypothetical protein